MNGISIKLDDKNYVFLLKFYLNDNDDDLLNYFNDFAAAAMGTMRMRLVYSTWTATRFNEPKYHFAKLFFLNYSFDFCIGLELEIGKRECCRNAVKFIMSTVDNYFYFYIENNWEESFIREKYEKLTLIQPKGIDNSAFISVYVLILIF